MKKVYYPTQKTFVKYDDEHFLLYLNEEIKENYLPENAEPDAEPFTAYGYSGTEPDGSTKIKATEATYPQFVSGLIRTQYSAGAVEAILLNSQSTFDAPKEAEHKLEFADLEEFRQECKDAIASLLQTDN